MLHEHCIIWIMAVTDDKSADYSNTVCDIKQTTDKGETDEEDRNRKTTKGRVVVERRATQARCVVTRWKRRRRRSSPDSRSCTAAGSFVRTCVMSTCLVRNEDAPCPYCGLGLGWRLRPA